MSLGELADYILEHWGTIPVESLFSALRSKIRRSKAQNLFSFIRRLLSNIRIAREVLSGVSGELQEIVAKRRMLRLALYLYAINVRGFSKAFVNELLSRVKLDKAFIALEDDFIMNNKKSAEVVCRFLELALVGVRKIEDIIVEIKSLRKVWESRYGYLFLESLVNVFLGIRTRVKKYVKSTLLKFSRAVIYSIICSGRVELVQEFISNIEQILPLDEVIEGCMHYSEYLPVGVVLLYYLRRDEFERRFNEIVERLKMTGKSYYLENIIVCLAKYPAMFNMLIARAEDVLKDILFEVYKRNLEMIEEDLKLLKMNYKEFFEESLAYAVAKNPYIIGGMIDAVELSKDEVNKLEKTIVKSLKEHLVVRRIVPFYLLPIDKRGIMREILRKVLNETKGIELYCVDAWELFQIFELEDDLKLFVSKLAPICKAQLVSNILKKDYDERSELPREKKILLLKVILESMAQDREALKYLRLYDFIMVSNTFATPGIKEAIAMMSKSFVERFSTYPPLVLATLYKKSRNNIVKKLLKETFKESVIKTLNGEIDASYLILLLTDDTLPKALVNTIIGLLRNREVRPNFKRDISEALIKRAILGLPEDVRSKLLDLGGE